MSIEKIAFVAIWGAFVNAVTATACSAIIKNRDRQAKEQRKELEAIKEHYKNAVTKEDCEKIMDEIWEWTNKYCKKYIKT